MMRIYWSLLIITFPKAEQIVFDSWEQANR